MLLFADGFETFSPYDLWRKWGYCSWYGPGTSTSIVRPIIVHGDDTTFSPAKPYARRTGGRAIQGTKYSLLTPIKPSRTVFTGFAFRRASLSGPVTITLTFVKGCPYDKVPAFANQNEIGDFTTPGMVVAACTLSISASYIDVSWSFVGTNTTTKTGRINTSANLLNGDWRYIQVGMTLMGNVVAQPQAWAEVRLGSRGDRLVLSNIMTADESGSNSSFLINAIKIVPGVPNYYSIYTGAVIGLDDVYICNDEGEFNNTFLGNVSVRRASVSGDGTENNSVPYGDTYRFRTVDEDYIDTVNSLPVPIPSHETTPLFIPWETFANDYLELEERGDRQLMRFTSLGAQGSTSKVYGAILHTLLKPQYRDTLNTLKAVRRFGTEELVESKPMDAPLIMKTEFESRHFIWENEETVDPGSPYLRWAPTAVDASEWGLELTPVAIAPETYDPAIVRVNLIIYDTVAEEIDLSELMHRYFEEFVDETFAARDDTGYEFVWAIYDSLVLESFTEGNRGGNRFLNETIEFEDVIPWTYLFAGEFIGFEEAVSIQFLDTIDEAIDVYDWADGFWEEVFTDAIEVTDETAISIIEILEEMFGLEEPYLWDGHELIEEELSIDADEPWDNHEILEEYLGSADEAMNGIGLDIADGFGLEETGYGFWVELFRDGTAIVDSILTQHWRYETMFGMVVSSWQVAPVEQAGTDGNHTGDNPWGA
jgi:hypothetical protein